MLPVSAEVIDLFRKHYRAKIEIDVAGVSGLTQLHDADLVEDGFALDRYCFPSDAFEIGTATEGEIEIELNNADGRFNACNFDGAFLTARLYIKKWDARQWEKAQIHSVPLGKFCVDDVTKNKSSITLSALDNMAQFDRDVGDYDLVFPATLGAILSHACTRCAVALATPTFPNSDFLVQYRPDTTDLTYHQIVSWVAQLAGSNAYCDHNGDLCVGFFTDTGFTLSPSDRTDSELSEDTATITGVCLLSTDDVEYLAGTTDCCINVEGNKLAQGDLSTVAANIYKQVGGFSYLPYSAEIFPCPFLMPMDMITYRDTAGGEHKTIVSNVTYSLFGKTLIDGKGIGKTQDAQAQHGEMTAYERFVIDQTKKQLENKLAEEHAGSLLLNQIISGAVGLYRSEVKNDSGSSVWYYHDKATLAASTIIYTFNENGFAFTKSWNDGNPVWQYGITREGSAVLNALFVHKITTDMIDAETVTADKIAANAVTSDKIAAGAVTADKIQVEDLSAISAKIGGWDITDRGITKGQVAGMYSGDDVCYKSLVFPMYASSLRFYAGAKEGGLNRTHNNASVNSTGDFYETFTVSLENGRYLTGVEITELSSEELFDVKEVSFEGDTIYVHLHSSALAGTSTTFSITVSCTFLYGLDSANFKVLSDGSLYASALCVKKDPFASVPDTPSVMITNGEIRVDPGCDVEGEIGENYRVLYFYDKNHNLYALRVCGCLDSDANFVPLNVDAVKVADYSGTYDPYYNDILL